MMATSQKPDNSSDGYYLQGAKGYNNGIGELNTISKIYGHGEYAVDARSIKVEDLNKITGYNPLEEGTGNPYGDGDVNEYKNGPVIYTLTDSGVAYESRNGSGTSGRLKLLDLGATESSETLTIPESTAYQYDPVYDEDDVSELMLDTSPEYKMLFEDTNNIYYWFASSYVETFEGYVNWGLFYAECGYLDRYYLWGSQGFSWNNGNGANWDCKGVRAVVSLSPDITLSEGTVIEEGAGSWNLPEAE